MYATGPHPNSPRSRYPTAFTSWIGPSCQLKTLSIVAGGIPKRLAAEKSATFSPGATRSPTTTRSAGHCAAAAALSRTNDRALTTSGFDEVPTFCSCQTCWLSSNSSGTGDIRTGRIPSRAAVAGRDAPVEDPERLAHAGLASTQAATIKIDQRMATSPSPLGRRQEMKTVVLVEIPASEAVAAETSVS